MLPQNYNKNSKVKSLERPLSSLLPRIVHNSKIEIDSLKLRIPLHKVKNVNRELFDELELINLRTGELKGSYSPKYMPDIKGISSFKIETQSYFSQQRQTIAKNSFLTFGLNSKILKEDYFKGICNDNIKYVYNELIKVNAGKFSIDDLLKAECTDIDLKFDFGSNDIDNISFDSFTKKIRGAAKYPEIANRFCQLKNKGIEFGKRATGKYLKTPFLKFYYKKGELLTVNRDFFEDHLKSKMKKNEIPEFRCETTLKNKKHLNKFNVDNSLSTIILLTIEKKQEVFNSVLSQHINDIFITKEKAENRVLNTKDRFIGFLINKLKNYDLENTNMKILHIKLLNEFCEDFKISKQAKYSLKKSLEKIKL